jgi:hypothetical protein
MFYGQRDFRSDGSYITTEWFTLFYIPLVPFRSFRVKYKNFEKTDWNASVTRFDILEKTGPNFRQALSIYGFFAVLAGVAWLNGEYYDRIAAKTGTTFATVLTVMVFALALALPLITRYLAKQALKEQINP